MIILPILELFHIIKHLEVIFKGRKYSKTTLLDSRHYFILDVITSILSLISLWGELPSLLALLVVINILGHIYYIITWPQSKFSSLHAEKIINWTSREYLGPHYTYDFFMTLFFDVASHSICFCYLII